jgi:hypothetical protein
VERVLMVQECTSLVAVVAEVVVVVLHGRHGERL